MVFLRSFLLLIPYLLTTILLSPFPTNAKSSTGDSVLVIVDPAKKDDYSMFLSGLKEQGYEVTLRGPKDDAPTLFEYDEPSFAHIVVLASETKAFAKDITPQSLVHLLTRGTNLLLTLSTKQTPLTSLAAEFGIAPPPPGTPLLSYFPERSDPPSVIPVSIPYPVNVQVEDKSKLLPTSPPILSPDLSSHPIWFSGVPHTFTHPPSSGPNPRLVPILRAPVESFASEIDGGLPDELVSATERNGEGLWAGSQMGLVTGFQAEGGARVAWAGGAEMFEDKFFKKEVVKGVKSGNQQFARDLVAWTFQESLVLRIDRTEHRLIDSNYTASKSSLLEGIERETYTINDHILYTAYISKYNPSTGDWEPYSGINDLQLEFTMLDPHLRIPLLPVAEKQRNEKVNKNKIDNEQGKYAVTFRAPDRHGVFKFVLRWRRKGYSYLESSTTIALTPPRHDGYPRFLSAAWPYYTGALSTSVAFFAFCVVWLAASGSREKGRDSGATTVKASGKGKGKSGMKSKKLG